MKSRTILHAEDDENDAFFLRRTLLKLGVTNSLTQVPDGEVALHYIKGIGSYSDREKHPFPCLLITDLKMPILSGFDLLAEIKDMLESKQLRAIVLTASVAESDKERCLQLGASGCYVKPPDFSRLIAVAAQIKESWLPAITEPA